MAKTYKALMLPIELHKEVEKLAKKNGVTMIEWVKIQTEVEEEMKKFKEGFSYQKSSK